MGVHGKDILGFFKVIKLYWVVVLISREAVVFPIKLSTVERLLCQIIRIKQYVAATH